MNQTNRILMIFILSFFLGSISMIQLTFKYSAKKTQINFQGKSNEFTYQNKDTSTPKKLIVYYVDSSIDKKFNAKNFPSLVKKIEFKRSEKDLAIEIQQKNRELFERLRLKALAKANHKNEANDAEEEETEDLRKIDSEPLQENLELDLQNADPKRLSILDLGSNPDVAAIMLLDTAVLTVFSIFNLGNENGCLLNQNSYNEFVDAVPCFEFFKSLKTPPTAINGELDSPVRISNWVEYSNFAFTLIAASDNESLKYTLENNKVNISLYGNDPCVMIEHENINDIIFLRITQKKRRVIILNLDKETYMKKIRLFLTDEASLNQQLYEGLTTGKGSFDLLESKFKGYWNSIVNLPNQRVYLTKQPDGIKIEFRYESSKSSQLCLGVIHSQETTQATFYEIYSSSNRFKKTIKIQNRDKKPIEFFFVNVDRNSVTKLDFESKLLLQENLLRQHHFMGYLYGQRVINEEGITFQNVLEHQAIEDNAIVNKGKNEMKKVSELDYFQNNLSNKIQIILYSRDAGVPIRINPTSVDFVSYNLKREGYINQVVELNKNVQLLPNFVLTFSVYDILGNAKEFPMKIIEVVQGKLFFTKISKSFQNQLREEKFEVCEMTSNLLHICLFSGHNKLEVDETSTGVVIWDAYRSHKIDFVPVKQNFKLEILLLKTDGCEFIDKNAFAKFKNQQIQTKWFSFVPEGQYSILKSKLITNNASRTNLLLLSHPSLQKLTEEELNSLQVDAATKSCKISKREEIVVQFKKGTLTFEEKKFEKMMDFKQVSDFEFDSGRAIVTDGVLSASIQEKTVTENDVRNIKLQYYFANDVNNEIYEGLFSNSKSILNFPVLLFSDDSVFQEIESFHQSGNYELTFTKNSLLFETDETIIGTLFINEFRVNVNKETFKKAKLRLFIQGLTPTTFELNFVENFNPEDVYSSNKNFKQTIVSQGNVNEIQCYLLSTKIKDKQFLAYYVETQNGELEILLLNQDDYDLFEVTPDWLLPMSDSFKILSTKNKHFLGRSALCGFYDTSGIPIGKNALQFANRVYGFWKTDTAFGRATYILILNKSQVVKSNKPGNVLEGCMYNKNFYDVMGIAGFIDLKENYNMQRRLSNDKIRI